jgi:O-ureido-D-serine cyclo-ligase
VRWNSDKRYLLDFARLGVPTVPTIVVGAGELGEQDWQPPVELAEFVVKPAVGAGSKGAMRFTAEQIGDARVHARELMRVGKTVLVQPYLSSVDSGSETALIHFGGDFSHAITKGPMLRREGKAEMVDDLYVVEEIEPRTPTDWQRAIALQVLAAVPDLTGGHAPFYARVDLIDDDSGQPVLLELEVIEPSLFFAHDPRAAQRYARVIAERLWTP